jgi:hypothetical protein
MPPRPRILPIDAGLAIAGHRLSDHNRGPISISPERFENRKRMANGTLRNFVVSQKRKIKTSWENLPAQDAITVDGFWGANSISGFYDDTFGAFTLRLTYGDKTFEDILVMFADFSIQLRKRGGYTDLYSVDVTFEEV